jgi:hypothetical protein
MLVKRILPNDGEEGEGNGGGPVSAEDQVNDFQVFDKQGALTSYRKYLESEGNADESEAEADEEKDTQEQETETLSDDEDFEDDDVADEAEEGGEADKRPKRRVTAKQRINQLTKRSREAERENQELRERLARIEGQLTGSEKSDTSEQGGGTEKPKSESADTDDLKEPDPNEYEFGEIDPKFARDLAKYESRKAVQAYKQEQDQKQQQEAAERQAKELQTSYQSMVERGAKAYDDFQETVVDRANSGGFPLSQEAALMILESDVGEHVAYKIASDKGVAEKLNQLSGPKLARAIGRLEAQISSEQGASSKKSKPKASDAPSPVKRSRGAGGQFETPPETSDFAAFEQRVMREQRKKRG